MESACCYCDTDDLCKTGRGLWSEAVAAWRGRVPESDPNPAADLVAARVELVNAVMSLVRRMDRHQLEDAVVAGALDSAARRFAERARE